MTPKSNVAFTSEENSKLIELVSNHACLYDLENKFYKNILVKENVWQQISDVLKKTGKHKYINYIFIPIITKIIL